MSQQEWLPWAYAWRPGAQHRIRSAQAQAREAERANAELALLMKELSELQGQLTDRGIVLTIGDVLFATGKSDLNASAQRSMGKIAEFLQNSPLPELRQAASFPPR